MADLLTTGHIAERIQTLNTSPTPLQLTISSGPYLLFSGNDKQVVILPGFVNTFPGQRFVIMNRSAAVITIEQSPSTFLVEVGLNKDVEVRRGDAGWIISEGGITETYPLKLTASSPPNSLLNIHASLVRASDGSGQVASPIETLVIDTDPISINFLTGEILGGTVTTGPQGPAFSVPYTTIGEYRRLALAAQSDGSIAALLSPADADLSLLQPAGEMLDSLSGLAVGYADLEAVLGSLSLEFLPADVDTGSDSILAGTLDFTFDFTDVNDVTDTINVLGHGLINEQAVFFRSSGTMPSGVSPNVVYYVSIVDTDSFQISETPGGLAVDIADQGTGTHSLYSASPHNFFADQLVSFLSSGTLPSGLSLVTNYFVSPLDDYRFQVSLTAGGSAEPLVTQGTGTHEVVNHGMKTASSITSIIENAVGLNPRIFRFGGGGGGGGGGSLSLNNGGIETLVETTETTYSIDSGKVNFHPFMHVITGHTLTVPSGANLLTTDDVIDGTVVVQPGGVWKVL